jgi:hypothetical protein
MMLFSDILAASKKDSLGPDELFIMMKMTKIFSNASVDSDIDLTKRVAHGYKDRLYRRPMAFSCNLQQQPKS